MNKAKRVLRETLSAPTPDQGAKTRFIRRLPKQKISMLEFVLRQLPFCRKSSLLLSSLLLIPALGEFRFLDLDTIWVISALIPFLALLAVSESTRSAAYGMGEFEMSARFSMRNVVLARLIIWGVIDFGILCCITPLCYAYGCLSVFQISIYLLVPYLLTASASLWITRRIRNKESVMICMATAAFVSGINVGLHFVAGFIYQLSFFNRWLLLAAVSAGLVAYEIYHTIKGTEEYTWNLPLTD